MKRIKSRIKEAKLQFMVKSNILILAIIAFFPYALSAKGIENHVQDMQDVFPLRSVSIFFIWSQVIWMSRIGLLQELSVRILLKKILFSLKRNLIITGFGITGD